MVIPIYNEEGSLTTLLSQLKNIRDRADFEIEFILVDDGSTDGTPDRLESIREPKFRVIRHEANLGYGAAIKTGVREARYSRVGITDADGTYPNDRIPELYRKARDKNLDMVVGARTGEHVSIPWIKRPPKWVLNKLADYLTRRKIPDLNSGLRIMTRESLERHAGILPDGFSLTTTITLALLKEGRPVEFVPIDYARRTGRSKIRPIYDTLNFLQLILRVVMYFDPLAVFLPLGLTLIGLSFLFLFGSWLFLERAMDVTFGVTLMTGVILLAIGMLADFIDKRMR
jgi:glycosyltransferase involved in cell wall biosynthesis